jgi:hypothetical protein
MPLAARGEREEEIAAVHSAFPHEKRKHGEERYANYHSYQSNLVHLLIRG